MTPTRRRWRSARCPAGPPASVRFSRHLEPWSSGERRRRRARQRRARRSWPTVEAGRANFDLVRHPLLPYQREGMLHLAFGERALLADEMGLGKTVQAIAACEILRRDGYPRVLVVLPASLKAEWEDQIARFTDLRSRSFPARGRTVCASTPPTRSSSWSITSRC